SRQALTEAEQAVMDLGVFTSVKVAPLLESQAAAERGRAGPDPATAAPQEEAMQAEAMEAELATSEPTAAEPSPGGEVSDAPRTSVDGAPVVVPVHGQAHPGALRTLRLGGGAELDIIRTGIRGLASWEHRNLFGGLRRFLIAVEPGVVLFPTRVPEFHA